MFSADGERFVVDGYRGPGDTGRHVAAFDGLTVQLLWQFESKNSNPHGAGLCIDPLGTTVSVLLNNDRVHDCALLDARTGKHLGHLPKNSADAIGPGGQLSIGGKGTFGCGLYRLGHNAPLVTLGIDSLTSSYVPSFNAAGTHVAWGNADGTVTLCDLPLLRRRLAELGLDWSK